MTQSGVSRFGGLRPGALLWLPEPGDDSMRLSGAHNEGLTPVPPGVCQRAARPNPYR